MMTRIITGACLVAVLAFALAMGGWVFSVLYMASICVSMYEVYRAMGEAGHRPVQWPSWLCLVLSVPLFMVSGSVSPLLPLVANNAIRFPASFEAWVCRNVCIGVAMLPYQIG